MVKLWTGLAVFFFVPSTMLFLVTTVPSDSRNMLELCTFSFSSTFSVSVFSILVLLYFHYHLIKHTVSYICPVRSCYISTAPSMLSPPKTSMQASGVNLFSLMTVENNSQGSSLEACFSSVPQPPHCNHFSSLSPQHHQPND